MSVVKARRRALVREVNPHLICVLCSGYFIEATTIVECLHTFCRSCLVKYLENSKFCPICDVQLHKNNPLSSVRCDPTLQQLVYKLIPGLYSNEMARRRKYYSELGGPTSDPDCGVFPIGDQYFSPDDSISLSLEFINNGSKDEDSGTESEENSLEKQAFGIYNVHHRRYLQCPAAVTMSHLKKFLRMKYCLSHDHKVDIIYAGEVVPDEFSLMDIAYIFSWNKTTPMRFKFRLLQKHTVPVPEPPPVKVVELKEPTPPPPAVLPEPEPTPPAKQHQSATNRVQLKTLSVQVHKLPANKILAEPIVNKNDTKVNKMVEQTVTNNNNYSPPKVKPLVRHKPGPKSKTEHRNKMEVKLNAKTSPERLNSNLKRNLNHVDDNLKETNVNGKVKDEYHEPEKKKSKLQLNESQKNRSENTPHIEPFAINKQEKLFDGSTDDKKKKKKEEKMYIDKDDYDEEMYEIGKWHMEDKRKKVEEKKQDPEKVRLEEMYEIGKWHMDDKKNKTDEKKPELEKKHADDKRRVEESNAFSDRKCSKEDMLVEDKKLKDEKKCEEKESSVEKAYTSEKKNGQENRAEERRSFENRRCIEDKIRIDGKKFFKENSYLEKLQEEEDDEDRLRISTPPVEDMVVEEKVPDAVPSPPVAEVQPIMRSEERRKEKKKNKKAKHHHHHRHHDRKRDSPPAATILHSPENDIMKLKIKLTEVNSKVPKYSVVDGNSDDRKEPKENGHSHKSSEKYAEKEKEKYKEKEKSLEKSKAKDEEPKLIGEIISNKTEYNQVSKVDSLNKEKSQQVKPSRPKIMTKPIVASKQNANIKQDVANVKPIMQSPPIKIHSPPPRQSPSPKTAAAPKPTAPTAQKINGTIEPLKMPPSTITVSKITAEEKRQMEQQKLLMSRNNNNGLDSKRPSLEIMLVNAPKKSETPMSLQTGQPLNNDAKPVEVKKVIRPTPPSIPLSRLGKGVGFGAKGSPPPLVLANKSCHDDSGVLDLSGKSSRKSPEIDTVAMRNLVTLSDTAVQVRNGMLGPETTTTTNNNSQLKIPMPSLTKPLYQTPHQRAIKPGPNQNVRQIPNPSALMFRQHTINGRSLPPPGVPLSSLRKMESMTRNLEKVTAGLTVKAAVEAAGYATK